VVTSEELGPGVAGKTGENRPKGEGVDCKKKRCWPMIEWVMVSRSFKKRSSSKSATQD